MRRIRSGWMVIWSMALLSIGHGGCQPDASRNASVSLLPDSSASSESLNSESIPAEYRGAMIADVDSIKAQLRSGTYNEPDTMTYAVIMTGALRRDGELIDLL